MPVPCFCCLFVSEIYFWKYSRNALEIFEDFLYTKTKSQSEGEPEGRPRGQVRPPAAGKRGPVGGARPCPWDLTSRPSDAYKIIPVEKTLPRRRILRNMIQSAVGSETKFRGTD